MADPIKIHDLKPAAARTGARSACRPGHRAARAARPPAAAPRARRPATRWPVGFEGGQMPLHMRIPKLKGFNNPFRVEYQGINLDVIEETELAEVSPATLARQGPRPQGRPREGARPWRATRARSP